MYNAMQQEILALGDKLQIIPVERLQDIQSERSFFSYIAYYTDFPCEEDDWDDLRVADACKDCRVCLNSCPTGAIQDDRFLINNEKCISLYNEFPGKFPKWIQFDEKETDALLSGKPLDTFSPTLMEKCIKLGLIQWINAIPRNLKVLIDNYAPNISNSKDL